MDSILTPTHIHAYNTRIKIQSESMSTKKQRSRHTFIEDDKSKCWWAGARRGSKNVGTGKMREV
jgi:hypothetical protein